MELACLACFLGLDASRWGLSFFPGADCLGEPPGRHLSRFGMGADPIIEVDIGLVLTTTAGEEPHFAWMVGVRVVGTATLGAGAGEVEGQQAA